MWTHIHSVFRLFWAGSCCDIHTCTGRFPNRHTCVHSRHSLRSKSWPLEKSHKQTATQCFLNAPLLTLLQPFGYYSVRSTQTFDCQIDCNGKLRFSVCTGRKTFIINGKHFWIKSSLEFVYILRALEGSHSLYLALWMMMFPCRVWAGRFMEP